MFAGVSCKWSTHGRSCSSVSTQRAVTDMCRSLAAGRQLSCHQQPGEEGEPAAAPELHHPWLRHRRLHHFAHPVHVPLTNISRNGRRFSTSQPVLRWKRWGRQSVSFPLTLELLRDVVVVVGLFSFCGACRPTSYYSACVRGPPWLSTSCCPVFWSPDAAAL